MIRIIEFFLNFNYFDKNENEIKPKGETYAIKNSKNCVLKFVEIKIYIQFLRIAFIF